MRPVVPTTVVVDIGDQMLWLLPIVLVAARPPRFPVNTGSALSPLSAIETEPVLLLPPVRAIRPPRLYVFDEPAEITASAVFDEELKTTVRSVPAAFSDTVPTLPFGPVKVGVEYVAVVVETEKTSWLRVTGPEPFAATASDKRFDIVPLVITAELLCVNDGKLR